MKRFLLLSNPRTGSEYLSLLLRQHPDIGMTGELLNDEIEVQGNEFDYIEGELAKLENKLVGFKVFPKQIIDRNLRIDDIVRHIGADYVIVLWRKSTLEQFYSLKIAEKTGIWFRTPKYDSNNNSSDLKIEIRDEEIKGYKEALTQDWITIASQWPIDIIPIFVSYEDIYANTMKELNKILGRMSCESGIYENTLRYFPLNPPVQTNARISNWDTISDEAKQLNLNVETIINEIIAKRMCSRSDAQAFLPDPEPTVPPKGWVYNVCVPFMPNEAKDNVAQALAAGSVSSAGFWPKQLSIKLKEFFGVPVVQTCNNGFTGLVLSMQINNISAGDEVIMPSMTMIAVPNAVVFVGATPVFADSAQHNYNPGLKEILEVTTNKTRALVLTHTYGVPTPDLELIVNECTNRGWVLIEDISECVGVKVNRSSGSKLLGTFGQIACASLYANKIIHSGDGGFVLSKDPKHEARFKSLANHGFTPNYHFVHFECAINAKINGLGAALAVGCVDRIEQVLNQRKQLSQWYRKYLEELPIDLMPECGSDDTPWVFGLLCSSKSIRTQLRAYMARYGIETRDFFFPLHFQPAFKYLNNKKRYPRAETLGSTGFYLPTYYSLREEDIVFITNVMKKFFNGKQSEIDSQLIAPTFESNQCLVLRNESFGVEVQRFNKSGQLEQKFTRGHPFINALALNIKSNLYLMEDNWSNCQEFLRLYKDCIRETIHMKLNPKLIQKSFKHFVDYFQSQSSFEPQTERPWVLEDLKDPEYAIAHNVHTTSQRESLQLLVWLIKQFKPKSILELGPHFGHSTLLMAIAAKTYERSHYKTRIYACDAFIWQPWMSNLVKDFQLDNGQSFLPNFEHNIRTMNDIIEPIVMNFDFMSFEFLNDIQLDFISFDFTQEWDELEVIWNQLEPKCIADKTILIFNGVSERSLPFFSRQSNKLKPLAKAFSTAKVYLYAPKDNIVEQIEETRSIRKFNFQSSPNWTHHHKNSFIWAINQVKNELHDQKSDILFIPAVEETLCDNPDIIRTNPWIGIIHMTVDYPELFYYPDLRRICSKKYAKHMQNCKGLFTLTTLQSQYLNNNLQLDYKMPIQPIVHPFVEQESNAESIVLKLLESQDSVELLLIGGFARDYSLFVSAIVPKLFNKVILINDENSAEIIRQTYQSGQEVELRNRLPDDQYEQQLFQCIPFLSIKYDGACNTLILECIARNIPILVPNMSSCVEYIGEEYPLLYNKEQKDFTDLLTIESIESAINYLKSMNKNKFQINYFINSIKQGIVSQSLPSQNTQNMIDKLLNPRNEFNEFDVTLLICSYKRTHHLSKILDSLWNGQTFKGKMQLIIWNNNDSRMDFVRSLCQPYLIRNNTNKSLELIGSTKNHFCSVRLMAPQLMQSQCLLICDDDCIPGPEFIQFFLNSHNRYPNDILCLRGHEFFDHKLDVQNPNNFWTNYDYLRFRSDEMPEQSLHFFHADACLLPISALQECASLPMPDQRFALVDDYWMSYVLNHKFGRNLRKLSTKQLGSALIERTEDSDQIGLAMYTWPDVIEARDRLYIHHMLEGWPQWETNTEPIVDINDKTLREVKNEFWNQLFVGFNISSDINEQGVDYLANSGVTCVRIGSVGLGDKYDYEFRQLLTNPTKLMNELKATITLLKSRNIRVVLTLYRELATNEIWRFIAENLYSDEFVVGYDLINEPYTQYEKDFVEAEVDHEYPQFIERYIDIIKTIRQVDKVTPIIIESSYYAYIHALKKLPIDRLLSIDDNILVSFHFYEPQLLTFRAKNKNRFSFPSEIPVYENAKYSETIRIDDKFIRDKFLEAIEWSQNSKVKLVLGEFGISREIKGAVAYMTTIMKTCAEFGINSFIYSFRDEDWDVMDYELGDDIDCGIIRKDLAENTLMQTLLNGIKACILEEK